MTVRRMPTKNKMKTKQKYSGQGDPWADFLQYRKLVIAELVADGFTNEQIAEQLSTTPLHVELIIIAQERGLKQGGLV